MTCRTLLTVCTLGFALSLSCSAMAQSGKATKKTDAPSEPPAESTHEPDRNLLAGPQVEEEAEAGRGNPMTAPNNVGKARAAGNGGGGGLPFRQWMDVVRGVTLAPEQQEKIAVIAGEFQTAQRRFQRENGEQMRKLQEQVRLSRENGTNPPDGVREQYQKFEAAMPKQTDYQQRVWTELSAEQQSSVRGKLAEMEQRRAAEKAGKAGKDSGGGMLSTSGMTMTSGGGATPTGTGTGDRNDSKKDSTEGMGTTSGETKKAAPSTEQAPSSDNAPTTPRERAKARLRSEGGKNGDAQTTGYLDARAQKRLKFLQQHQSAGHSGNAPTATEKTFKFNESGES